jgi:hypothetical protein
VRAYRIWFQAAAFYNLLWGGLVVFFPVEFCRLLGLGRPEHPALVQVLGMVVGVFAFGYYLLAKDPVRYGPIVWIGLAGKVFGPIGFLIAALRGELPWSFGWTILTNDLIWWPAFWTFALRYGRPL